MRARGRPRIYQGPKYNRICPVCKKVFECGMDTGAGPKLTCPDCVGKHVPGIQYEYEIIT